MLAAAAVVAALVLLLVAPWSESGGPGLTGRALAAIGNGPILHAVVRYQLPGQRVELPTGKTRPIIRTADMWADEQRGLLLVVGRADGHVISRRTVRQALDPFLPFGLAALYRQGLEDGKLRRREKASFVGGTSSGLLRPRFGASGSRQRSTARPTIRS